MTTSQTSRRAVLAGLAVLPIASAAVAAPAHLDKAPQDDPIFAAIEVHKRAHGALCEATSARREAEDRFSDHFGHSVPSVVLATRAEWNSSVAEWPFGDVDVMRLFTADEIDCYTAGPAGPASRMRNNLRKGLAAAKRAYHRDVAPFDRALSDASAAEFEAREEMLTTEPTTMAGLAALLSHVRSFGIGDFFLGDECDTFNFLTSVERALRQAGNIEGDGWLLTFTAGRNKQGTVFYSQDREPLLIGATANA